MRDGNRRWWHRLGKQEQATRQEHCRPHMQQGEYRSYRAVHPFDERLGVDTSGLIYDLPSGHRHDIHNNGYFAVAPSVFHGVIEALRERLQLDLERFTFIDIGSGKGRALMLAAGYPFRQVIGVELSPDLDRIARSNLARYAGAGGEELRAPVTCLQGDAADFRWPTGPLIVYLWNAFTQPVLKQLFLNMEEALQQAPRELYLIYMHPELESTFVDLEWLERVWRDEFVMSDEDYEAWAFPSRAELCALYRADSSKLAATGPAVDTKV